MIKDDEENIKEEVWPPTDINPFAPLELPIGPSTVAARVAFDSKVRYICPLALLFGYRNRMLMYSISNCVHGM